MHPVPSLRGRRATESSSLPRRQPWGKICAVHCPSLRSAFRRATRPMTEGVRATAPLHLQKSNPHFLPLRRLHTSFFSANELRARSESGANHSLGARMSRIVAILVGRLSLALGPRSGPTRCRSFSDHHQSGACHTTRQDSTTKVFPFFYAGFWGFPLVPIF